MFSEDTEFDFLFKTKLDARWPSFKAALTLLGECEDRSVHILETGCQRLDEDWGGGCSSLIFAWYLQNYTGIGSTLTSVDISEQNLSVAANVLGSRFPNDLRHWDWIPLCGDSVELLGSLDKTYDLIYLDSYDTSLEHRDISEMSQHYQVMEANIAVKLFSTALPNKILLLDDNNLPFGGKTKLAKKVLRENGWSEVLSHQQSLWITRT